MWWDNMAILNMTDSDYWRLDAINASALKVFIQDPIYYKNRFVTKVIQPKFSEALTFGSALHCYVLEHDKFGERFVIKPEGLSLVTKEGKAWKAENADKSAITAQEMVLISALHGRMMDIMPFDWIMAEQQHKEIVVTKPLGERWLKSKVDWLIEFDDYVANIDLKTTTDLSDFKLSRTIYDFQYDVQGAFYDDLISYNYNKPVKNYLFFLDKNTGNARIINIDNEVNNARAKVADAITRLDYSLTNNRFSSPYQDLTKLTIPEWRK